MVCANIVYAKARGSLAGIVVFATPLAQCLQRVQTRRDHPTLSGESEESKSIVLRMANSCEFPTRDEGLVFCRVIRTEEDFERVFNEIVQPQA